MGYKPSPRPVFDRPTLIPYAGVTRHLWGEENAGLVDDWIYASTESIHQIVFGMQPGGCFKHTEAFRTIFGADEVLYVLSGTLGLANPETGEFCVAREGEALFFRKDTWHHGFNLGNEQVRVLEFFAPPPAKGTSGPYARTKPYIEIEQSRYGQSEFLGRWPMEAAAQRKARTIHPMRDADLLFSLDQQTQGAYTGLFCATDQLTVGKTTVLAGKRTGIERHKGDECLYVVSGTLNIHVLDAEGQAWFELNPRDGFYIPAGADHQYFNMSADKVEFVFGVAPEF
ncbi:cupin domain-containing protein [Ensifer sp.]|jgi:quercetin dioxygenase-like cupin family protein|uniref:cupin domain-containing protein n=1 Tax=Ensifer sp. TaxID=1872086 RepID=UPI002E12581B|nr:cupin domain-containing protein [Ensifer sp.]